MGFLALLVGLALIGLVIAGIIFYWIMMITLIALGVVFLLWVYLFLYFFPDSFVALFFAVVATGLTIWAFGALTDKKSSDGKQGTNYDN